MLFKGSTILAETLTAEPGLPGTLPQPVGNRTDGLDFHDRFALGNDKPAEVLVVRQEPGKLRATPQEIVKCNAKRSIWRAEGVSIITDLHRGLMPGLTHPENLVNHDPPSATYLLIHSTQDIIIAQAKFLGGINRHGETPFYSHSLQLVLHLQKSCRGDLGRLRAIDAQANLAATLEAPLFLPVAVPLRGIIILGENGVIPGIPRILVYCQPLRDLIFPLMILLGVDQKLVLSPA